jgi:hypothetical protein
MPSVAAGSDDVWIPRGNSAKTWTFALAWRDGAARLAVI